MSYFRVCEYYGDNLDPGEKCDCRERKKESQSAVQKIEYPKEGRYAGRAVCVQQSR